VQNSFNGVGSPMNPYRTANVKSTKAIDGFSSAEVEALSLVLQ
jgi:hypothetical protein